MLPSLNLAALSAPASVEAHHPLDVHQDAAPLAEQLPATANSASASSLAGLVPAGGFHPVVGGQATEASKGFGQFILDALNEAMVREAAVRLSKQPIGGHPRG